MEVLANIIVITIVLILFFGGLSIQTAWDFGGEFYIHGNFGRRKKWIERLLDGFEVLRRM